MSSQYGEHEFILNHFSGRKGRFLDIGAHDGKIFSNTWPLTEHGWTGVLVEPSPWVFPYLVKNYEGREGFEFVNAPIAVESGIVPWFDCGGDCYSTTEKPHKDKIEAGGVRFAKTWTGAIGTDDFFLQFWGFDFVNIDVEGSNAVLLKALASWCTDNLKYKPQMICVELDPIDEVKAIATAEYYNYNQTVIGGNLLLWRS